MVSYPINVGVFPCGSEVGLEIYRSLSTSRHFQLIGLSSLSDNGRVHYKNYDSSLPMISDSSFIEMLNEVISKWGIKFLIPAMDEAGYMLAKHTEILCCEVVYPEIEVAKILRRKTLMYSKLHKIIPVPQTYELGEVGVNDLPVFVKPDIGYGGRGTFLARDIQELQVAINKSDKESLICEYLPGEELTVDCFSSREFNILFAGPRTRSRVRMGISVETKTVSNLKLVEYANRISNCLGMKGAWFFQVKRSESGEFKLLEVAGRVSGSMALYRGLGVNFILLDLFQRLGERIVIPEFRFRDALLSRGLSCNLLMDIDFKVVYCDLDDCLILNGQVNTKLLRFLFDCINRQKKVVLLTKHAADLYLTLKRYRISEFWDEIVHIDKEDMKYEYVSGKECIFIDDSYKERVLVWENCGIPVFSPDAVELLIT